MRTIHLNIPDSVDLKDYDFSMIIAAKLYEDAKLSAGQAAKMIGLSKKALRLFKKVCQFNNLLN